MPGRTLFREMREKGPANYSTRIRCQSGEIPPEIPEFARSRLSVNPRRMIHEQASQRCEFIVEGLFALDQQEIYGGPR